MIKKQLKSLLELCKNGEDRWHACHPRNARSRVAPLLALAHPPEHPPERPPLHPLRWAEQPYPWPLAEENLDDAVSAGTIDLIVPLIKQLNGGNEFAERDPPG